MKQNLKLLIAIRKRGFTQQEFARTVGENPALISRVINGWANLDEPRKREFAKALKCKQDDIF